MAALLEEGSLVRDGSTFVAASRDAGGVAPPVQSSSSVAFCEGLAETAGGTACNSVDAAAYAQAQRLAADIPHDGSSPFAQVRVDDYEEDFSLPPCIPLPIEFTDLTYDVKVVKKSEVKPGPLKRMLQGMGLAKAGEMENLRVLHGLTGRVPAGKMVALMGASGAGKSTLLNMLSQHATPTGGVITYGGVTPPAGGLMKVSAFVQQLDLFINNLTVQEQIETQLQLRLPSGETKDDIQDRKKKLISRTNLVKCQANKIAGPFGLGGISGGEKKRLNVACEISTMPSILFADEPTTGLDSHMAISIVRVLKLLADHGRTVIATIHQPSSKIFELFSELVLLAEGRLLYCGPRDGSVAWFADMGYRCPSTSNPADFLIKLVAMPEGEDARAKKLESVKAWADKWTESGQKFLEKWEAEGRKQFRKQVEDAWEKDASLALGPSGDTSLLAFKHSAAGSFMLDPAAASLSLDPSKALEDEADVQAKRDVADLFSSPQQERPKWSSQMKILYRRAMMANKRDRMLFHARAMQTLIVSLLYMTMSIRLPWTYAGCRSRSGVAYAILLNQSMTGAMGVVNTFGTEKAVVQREYEAGVLRPSAYILSKMLADAPVQIIFPVIFTTIVHWGTAARDDFPRFLAHIGIVLLVSNAAMSLGYFASSVAPSPDLAAIIVNLTTLPIVQFGGFMVKIPNTPVFLRWLQYVSFVRYGFSNSLAILFGGNRQVQLPSGEWIKGSRWVEMEYDAHPALDTVIIYVIILIALLVVLRTLTCIVFSITLRRRKENA